MDELKQRILKDGVVLKGNILKVDAFLNHQVDSRLMKRVGEEFARRFAPLQPDKILTAEISGIAPALQAGVALDIPVIFARKVRPVTMPKNAYERHVPSRTKGGETLLLVSPEYLRLDDRVVILDDFLATGQTLNALANIVVEARAKLLAFGVVVEKTFEHGREALEEWNVPLEALVVIEKMSEKGIVFR
ncbi:MAG: xanthine phosphoribosyltransferase [Chloroflexi bacterium]|nr:xanthine phosphoribosyltransferase [Chloroflexota bacterium]